MCSSGSPLPPSGIDWKASFSIPKDWKTSLLVEKYLFLLPNPAECVSARASLASGESRNDSKSGLATPNHTCQGSKQTCRGSLSVVSKPVFHVNNADKIVCSIFQIRQDLRTSALLKLNICILLHYFAKCRWIFRIEIRQILPAFLFFVAEIFTYFCRTCEHFQIFAGG